MMYKKGQRGRGRGGPLEAAFTLFVLIALLVTYEPTAQFIKDLIGEILSFLFFVAVVGIIGFLVYVFFIRNQS